MTDFWDDFETGEEDEVETAAKADGGPDDAELAELEDSVEEEEEEEEEEYDSEEADSAVAAANDDDEEDVEEKKMIKASTPRRKSKKSGGKSKAEWIRDEITRRRDAGESLRPRDIIQGLADHGVAVVAPQISVALRDMGLRPTKEKETAASGPPANGKSFKANKFKPAETPVETAGAFSADEMQAALEQLGAVSGQLNREVQELIAAIARLQLGR